MRARQPAASWEVLIREHAAALDAFIRTAEKIPPQNWATPRDSAVWSPAELAEHLTLVYTPLSNELGGGLGFALKFSPWQRRLIRWRYLAQIIRHVRLPTARAPREIRPQGSTADPGVALVALREEGTQFAEAVSAARERTFTHPYMGTLSASQIIRYCTVHIRDHTGELPLP